MLLSGPVNSLTDFQLEFDGFLMGDGTNYLFEPPLDWLDLPALKTMDQARTGADGSWSGPDFADVRTLTLPGLDISDTTGAGFQAACVAFVNALRVNPSDRPLWMKLPGFPVMGVGAKIAKRSLPIDIGFELGTLATAAVQWRAVNPVWQSLPRTNLLTLGTGAGSGGLQFALYSDGVLDYGITTPAASAAVVRNGGNTDAPPLIAVTGPTTGFTITVDGHVVAYSDTLTSSDVVTVDYSTGRAALSSYGSTPADRTYLLTSRDFASVPAGSSSTITYAGTGGNALITTADLWR